MSRRGLRRMSGSEKSSFQVLDFLRSLRVAVTRGR
jgi:hypothetical protein